MAAEEDDMASPGRRVSRASHSISQASFVITSEITLTPGNTSQSLCLRTEIRGPGEQPLAVTSTYSTAAETSSFPQFIKLPPEVRRMVWKHSFGGPRIFRLAPSTDELATWVTMIVNHKPPSSGAACRESRQVFQQCGEFLFGVRGLAINSLWFRPSKDILFWDCMMLEDLGNQIYYPHCDFGAIKNVAVNWPIECSEPCLDQLMYGLDLFPGCKRAMLVMSHGLPLYNCDVEFLHIGEDDQREVCFYKGEKMSWAGLKLVLEEEYLEGKDSGESSEEERPLPLLEAVEVVPRRTA